MENETMVTNRSFYKEQFIVFNKKHLSLIPSGLKERFVKILSEVAQFLPANKYYVCNQDEQYAHKIIQMILDEENKEIK